MQLYLYVSLKKYREFLYPTNNQLNHKKLISSNQDAYILWPQRG
jgi:hypothetical protein